MFAGRLERRGCIKTVCLGVNSEEKSASPNGFELLPLPVGQFGKEHERGGSVKSLPAFRAAIPP